MGNKHAKSKKLDDKVVIKSKLEVMDKSKEVELINREYQLEKKEQKFLKTERELYLRELNVNSKIEEIRVYHLKLVKREKRLDIEYKKLIEYREFLRKREKWIIQQEKIIDERNEPPPLEIEPARLKPVRSRGSSPETVITECSSNSDTVFNMMKSLSRSGSSEDSQERKE